MVFKRKLKKKRKGLTKYYSVAKALRRDKKTTPQFEVMLNTLALEEVIALKLELAAKASGSPLYGVPIWKNLITIVRDAALKFAMSATRTHKEAARFLGMTYESYWGKRKYYGTDGYFEGKKVSKEEDN